MVIMPDAMAAMKPDFWAGKAPARFQIGLEENFLDPLFQREILDEFGGFHRIYLQNCRSVLRRDKIEQVVFPFALLCAFFRRIDFTRQRRFIGPIANPGGQFMCGFLIRNTVIEKGKIDFSSIAMGEVGQHRDAETERKARIQIAGDGSGIPFIGFSADSEGHVPQLRGNIMPVQDACPKVRWPDKDL